MLEAHDAKEDVRVVRKGDDLKYGETLPNVQL
jgi:hypothetical protein